MKIVAFYKPKEGIEEIVKETGIEAYEEPPDDPLIDSQDTEYTVIIHASQCPDGIPHKEAVVNNDYECLTACVAALCGETPTTDKYPKHTAWFRAHAKQIRGIALTSGSSFYDYKKIENARQKLTGNHVKVALDIAPKRVLGELITSERLLDYLRGYDSLELALEALLALLPFASNKGQMPSTAQGAAAETTDSFEDMVRSRVRAYLEGANTSSWEILSHGYSVAILDKMVKEAAAKTVSVKKTRTLWAIGVGSEIPDSLDSAIRLIASPSLDSKVWHKRLMTLRDILLPNEMKP